jgi:hypothetical protein
VSRLARLASGFLRNGQPRGPDDHTKRFRLELALVQLAGFIKSSQY